MLLSIWLLMRGWVRPPGEGYRDSAIAWVLGFIDARGHNLSPRRSLSSGRRGFVPRLWPVLGACFPAVPSLPSAKPRPVDRI